MDSVCSVITSLDYLFSWRLHCYTCKYIDDQNVIGTSKNNNKFETVKSFMQLCEWRLFLWSVAVMYIKVFTQMLNHQLQMWGAEYNDLVRLFVI